MAARISPPTAFVETMYTSSPSHPDVLFRDFETMYTSSLRLGHPIQPRTPTIPGSPAVFFIAIFGCNDSFLLFFTIFASKP